MHGRSGFDTDSIPISVVFVQFLKTDTMRIIDKIVKAVHSYALNINIGESIG